MNAYRLGLMVAGSLGVTLLMGADGCFGSETRDVPIGMDDAGPGVACGPNTCARGEVCCNESCGICTAPGEACIAIGCVPPPPGGETCGAVTCAAGETCCNASCGICVGPTESCSTEECPAPPPPPPGECGADECGMPPPVPRCPDPSVPPPECRRRDDGVCAWLVPRCPAPGDCTDAECGPAPGAPSEICADGTVAGPECHRDPAGICGWIITHCAEPPPPPPTECADPTACGPAPGLPAEMCWDGSIGGFTGRCLENPAAACPGADCGCHWEIRECPPMPPSECDPSSCGPAPGLPSYDCGDGSTGGPTGRCLPNADGTCGWEIRHCPCGPSLCDLGQVCCNSSCGICAAPDEGCITIACEPPVCHGEVACDSLPPVCPPGQVPSISGGCWGECVRAEACESVRCSGDVICAMPPPVCAEGQVPSISGGCWGPCVNAALCEPVRCTGDVLCDRIPPSCPEGQVPSVVGSCWGACVSIDSCECAGPSDCPMPDRYTCHMFRSRCGPFL